MLNNNVELIKLIHEICVKTLKNDDGYANAVAEIENILRDADEDDWENSVIGGSDEEY